MTDLRALSDAAAPGPWLVIDTNEGTWPPRPGWEIVNDAYLNPPADEDAPWLAVELHTGRQEDADFIAALVNHYRAFPLSASPASETREHDTMEAWGAFIHAPDCWCTEPASETPGPGAGDLRGEVDPSCCCGQTTARLVICPAHPERSHSDLLAALDARRADPEFMARIKASIEQHQPILDRLAEDEDALPLPSLNSQLRADVAIALAARDEAVEQLTLAEQKVARVEALFSGGPDTPCRTTWREELTLFYSRQSVECVEVPLDDLRAALADPESDR